MDESQPPQHSSIPQVLLDTENAWIIKHQSVLERLPDVESFLYSAPGTKYRTHASQLQHHDTYTRPASTDDELDLEVPADLFNTIYIENTHGPTFHRAGWPNAHQRLLELQRCPAAALARVRSLEVQVWLYQGMLTASEDLQERKWQDLEGSGWNELLRLFASVLTAMTGLERLRWMILPDFAARFREGLVGGRKLWLPSVNRLEVAPSCEYMFDVCPNVEMLKCESSMIKAREKGRSSAETLVEAAAKLPKVKEFFVEGLADLTPSFISTMVKSMPRLVRIKLYGRIPRPPPLHDPVTDERCPNPGGIRLKDILAVLAEFSDLEELDLPSAPNLRVGVTFGAGWCGTNSSYNLYSDAQAAEQNYRDHQHIYEHIEKVASMVVETLPHLKRLSIDGKEPTITHGEDGKASASWPWSGRFEEYYLNEILFSRRRHQS